MTEKVRDSSSSLSRTTNNWRVMSSCTSLPENPVKVVVDIPSTKPTISLLKKVAIFGNFMLPKTVIRSRKLVGTVKPKKPFKKKSPNCLY